VRRQLPRALFVLAVVVLAAALGIQVSRAGRPPYPQAPYPLAAALTAVYLAWLVAEARVTFGRLESAPAEQRTLVPYGLARLGTAAAAVLWPLPWTRWQWWMVPAVVAFCAGIALRSAAVVLLGRFYSHHVVRYDDHTVVTSGPYRYVRHPAYAGMLLAHAGFVAFFANPASVAMLVLLAAAVGWRLRVEERVLWTVPGYPRYAAGTARLVPGVW
jgi:protein-S-isoprenylcysteine O-methyltransferase Ste14